MKMANWQGAAGVCVNDQNELLVVLQKAPDEDSKWAVPAAGVEAGETLEQCCEREFREVTGLSVKVTNPLKKTSGTYENAAVSFNVQYFQVAITGGELDIPQDDLLIEAVAWKSLEELRQLPLAYPDDLKLFEQLLGGS